MIRLANDPNADRAPRAANEGKAGSSLDPRRGRSGHTWPFLSRYAARPVQQETQKPAANDSGS